MTAYISKETQALLLKENKADQIELADEHETKIFSQLDPEYPQILRHIPKPPTFLYVKGKLPPNLRAVACVGTRWPTAWGKTVAERVTNRLVKEGYSIVSGLAFGIDAIAHKAALAAGGQTIAILPCGLDNIYPIRHTDLADQMIEEGGALVSEQPFGASLHPHHFIKRNRLQSGLSLATMIVQSAKKGGTMHTAQFCKKQSRLLCVAEPQGQYIEEKESLGNLDLLKDPTTFSLKSADDYPKLLQILKSQTTQQPENPQYKLALHPLRAA
jgi:DNA processing protein